MIALALTWWIVFVFRLISKLKFESQKSKYPHGGNWDPQKMERTLERGQRLFQKFREI